MTPCAASSARSSAWMNGAGCGTACGAWLAGGGAPGPGLPTLQVALMLKLWPPLARPGVPSFAAAAGVRDPLAAAGLRRRASVRMSCTSSEVRRG